MSQIGRFEIIEEIGKGGFATVYKAQDTLLGREVALKIIHPWLQNSENFVTRFKREAKIVAKLDHPNIAPIYDIVIDEQDQIILVMKWMRGGSLAKKLKAKKFNWQETVTILDQLAIGLDHAHSSGLIHRDIKPENILFDEQDQLIISDFGIAKILEPTTSDLTKSDILGTPSYIAPEIWSGKKASSASDVYSAACLLYEMTTGERLFKGSSPLEVMALHLTPKPLPTIWPKDVPNNLGSVLTKALAQDPQKRYSTVGLFLQAIKDLADESKINSKEGTTIEKESSSKSLIGTKFGDYAVQKLIGEGGFAEVYLARDKLDRLVTLKILKKQFSFDDHFANMFRREATTAARLNHEHIILIYDQGEIEGLFYMAMEYAPEGTLEDYLKRKEGKLSRSEIRSFTQQIAEALHFAHANGIVHCDVKPSNILLSYNSRIKLTDFGIAQAGQRNNDTRYSTVIQGTAHYMAPEQANPSAKLDGRVDVYALGVVVYHMLSGQLPFDNVRDFVEQIQIKRTGKPKEIPGVPAYVQLTISKALSPTPDLRYRSAKEFSDDLIKAIDQWESMTAARQDKRDLIGTAMIAIEQEDWRAAKDYLEQAQKLGGSPLIENNLYEVNRRIKLQDEWAKINESFARADWSTAVIDLKQILFIEPYDESAQAKLAEAEKQIELAQLYQEGETAFAQEDYALAVERFEAIYHNSPDYRDVEERLKEFKQTQTKDEFNRLRVESLWALVENDLESARKHTKKIDELGLGYEYGTNTFLKKFNLLVESRANELIESTQTLADLKTTLKVRDAYIDGQTTEINRLKQYASTQQHDLDEVRKEINALQKEFTDRLYDYVSDLQHTLSYLERNSITRYIASELVQTLRERIRTLALRGQQLENKTIIY